MNKAFLFAIIIAAALGVVLSLEGAPLYFTTGIGILIFLVIYVGMSILSKLDEG